MKETCSLLIFCLYRVYFVLFIKNFSPALMRTLISRIIKLPPPQLGANASTEILPSCTTTNTTAVAATTTTNTITTTTTKDNN